MATSASTVGLPEDQAYLLHHFNCPYCISAGATPGKQERCPEGLQLWNTYNHVASLLLKTLKPNHRPARAIFNGGRHGQTW